MEEEKFKDLLEDEELTSLRLAALATKRKKEQNANKFTDSTTALPINSIVTSTASASESALSQIPFVQSDRNAFNNNYSWRKQNQSLRRRGGAFPKSNTRSNLIVISPVSLNDGKDLEEKPPALVLPQHKWCNSGNEDSMSPKTLRRTGPTRFNRHGSDSESSESDYENDNDSGSNETVLQDEPTEHFAHLSPGSDTIPDGVEKKRRLSFQNLESDIKTDTFEKGETTSIYNLLKHPSYDCSDSKPDSYMSVQNQSDCRNSWNHSVENDYSSYKQFNNGNVYVSEPVNSTAGKQISSLVVSNGEPCTEGNNFMTQSSNASSWQHTDMKNANSYYSREASTVFENSRSHEITDRKPNNYSEKRRLSTEIQNSDSMVWQHSEENRANKSFFPRETPYNAVDSRSYKNDAKMQFLSEDDLRFELKKRNLNQELKSKSTGKENHSEMLEKQYNQSNMWDNRQESSYGNRQECSNFQGSRNEQTFTGERNEYNLNLNSKQHERSVSRERGRQGRCSSRERSRYGYSSGPERSRRDRSSSQCRSRHNRSTSRGRSRRSTSRDRRRVERSSSQGRIKHESVQDSKRRKPGRSFSEERDGHYLSRSKSYQDKNREEYNSSQSKSRYERSSNNYKSNRERSSSSDSRHERSTSQDKDLEFSSNRSRSKRERSLSQDRKRYDRSSSQERSKRDHSSSRDRSRHRSIDSEGSRHGSSRSYKRSKLEDSSSQDESEEGYSSNQRRKYPKHSSGCTRSTYKNSQHKSRCDITSIQDKDRSECVSGQERSKDCNNIFEVKGLQNMQNSEKVKENQKLEKSNTKEESKPTAEKSRLCSSSEEKMKKGNKISLVKHSRVKGSYERYSRSRSSSSTSCSSSSSSSNSSRPKIRSISSVVKSVPTKITDTQKEESHSEIKSVGKNISLNISQSDVSSTSIKKNSDVGDYGKLSNFKCSRMDIDFKASDNNKRVPVHMRLGVLPRKRVIQMPKDVEAAFVNSSSSSDGENVSTKCKRQNIRIVTDVCENKGGFDFENIHSSEDKSKRYPDASQEKSKRLKIKR